MVTIYSNSVIIVFMAQKLILYPKGQSVPLAGKKLAATLEKRRMNDIWHDYNVKYSYRITHVFLCKLEGTESV